MGLTKFLTWWRWLLSFNPLKYLGILIMTAGPLYLLYLNLFSDLEMWRTLFGSFIFLFTGFILWLNGWDPYETLNHGSETDFLKSMKEVFGFLEWYKWVLSFNLKKYLALFLMIAGPLFFIYKAVFQNADIVNMTLYSAGVFSIGMIIWIMTWDPYS